MPSRSGWVFETSEPWGWATYHYGNWMPTTEYGWVWSPGSTWYPSTAAWRTSDDYVGWAPIPPPDYVPEPAFYPAGGYTPGSRDPGSVGGAAVDFRPGRRQFLLGFGQPYAPVYSYYNSLNCLAPFSYAPIVYGGTFPLTDFYYPDYAPMAFFGFGPPFPFVSRVSRVDIGQIHTFVNSHNFTMMHNVLPSGAVLGRYPFLRGAIPAAVLEGRGFPLTRVQDVARAEHALNRPGVLGPPSGLPVISHAMPRFTPTLSTGAFRREDLGHIKGMTLPREAERPLTPFMRQQIRVHHQMQGPPRIETQPAFRPLARPEAAPQVEVIRGVTPENVHPAGSRGFQPVTGVTTPEVIRGRTSRRFHSPESEGFQPVPPGNPQQEDSGSSPGIRQRSGFRGVHPGAPRPVSVGPGPHLEPGGDSRVARIRAARFSGQYPG